MCAGIQGKEDEVTYQRPNYPASFPRGGKLVVKKFLKQGKFPPNILNPEFACYLHAAYNLWSIQIASKEFAEDPEVERLATQYLALLSTVKTTNLPEVCI